MKAWLVSIKRVVLFYRCLTLLFVLIFIAFCWLFVQAEKSVQHQEGICYGCLYPIALTTHGDGWALPPLYWSDPFLLQQQGNQWQWTPLPLGSGHHTIETLSTDANGDVWAMVAISENLRLLLHQHAGQWTTLPQTQAFDFIDAFQMLSATNGWLLADTGYIHVGQDVYFAHYNGVNWQRVSAPSAVAYHALTFIADDNGWAVGDQGAIIHYTQGRWQSMPSPTTHDLYGIQMLSATNGWAVGDAGVTLHYDGVRWQAIALTQSANVTLSGLAMVSSVEGWATEFTHLSPYGASRLWHFQNNRWTPTSFADNQRFFGVAMRSATEGWAIGGDFLYPPDDGSQLDGHAIIAHYENGKWQVINAPPLPEPSWMLLASLSLSAVLVIGFTVTGLLIWNIRILSRNRLIHLQSTLIGSCSLLLSAIGQLCLLLMLFHPFLSRVLIFIGIVAAVGGIFMALMMNVFQPSSDEVTRNI